MPVYFATPCMKSTFRGFSGETFPLPLTSSEPEGRCSLLLVHFFENGRWGSLVEAAVEGQSLTAKDQLFILMQAGRHARIGSIGAPKLRDACYSDLAFGKRPCGRPPDAGRRLSVLSNGNRVAFRRDSFVPTPCRGLGGF